MEIQAIINLAPLVIGIGICLAIAGYFALKTKTHSNSLKGSPGVWFLPLIWLVVLALTFRFLPAGTTPEIYKAVAIGWFAVGVLAFLFYVGRRGVHLSPASIGHVAILVTYWLCNVRVQKTVKSHSTFELTVGLTEHVSDISLQQEGNPSREEIEQRLSRKMLNVFPARFDEAAMVATGGLDGATPIKLRVSGPAFRIQPDQQDTTAKTLTSHPARVLLFSEHHGEHFIRLEFVDNGTVRGGMTVPIRVTERFPLLPDWVGRAAMVFGGLAAGVFSIVQIVMKIIELLK
ncbi:MAG: hypothetical protein LBE78_06665 [Burkholderiaceae bacterium]|jgi:hypothetical protein|nr:hypothetical protein [Burkholderiaceae bacterium]